MSREEIKKQYGQAQVWSQYSTLCEAGFMHCKLTEAKGRREKQYRSVFYKDVHVHHSKNGYANHEMAY